ncbi:hypothetical protein BpHYR1_012320 [Brachionus plicatilis]|uniref:Uncharacterized protein n=1 Tax=Brachionus plicatilis TaxID=10195 RepID=A0A3M7R7A5_BRAPC|nr:hypothetical protein BpHYR1_012320 [Brachionus plicatilis]
MQRFAFNLVEKLMLEEKQLCMILIGIACTGLSIFLFLLKKTKFFFLIGLRRQIKNPYFIFFILYNPYPYFKSTLVNPAFDISENSVVRRKSTKKKIKFAS